MAVRFLVPMFRVKLRIARHVTVTTCNSLHEGLKCVGYAKVRETT